ncbi:MAG: lysophospholipase, partial [Oscillospiraceae bacterium]|nr:lysophospholipase [Oscillospiraceae bacterium]
EAPWFGLYKPIDYFYVTLINILSRIAPNHRVKQKLNKEALSSIKKRADNYTNDPLRHSYLSMRLLSGVLKACDYALENATKLPIPTYIAYASDDIIVSNETILKFASKAKSMVTLKEYESSHAIHNDTNREMFIKDVVRYMDGRLQ